MAFGTLETFVAAKFISSTTCSSKELKEAFIYRDVKSGKILFIAGKDRD